MFFSAVKRIYSDIAHIFRHKESFNKYREIKITPQIIPDDNGIKPEINSKNNCRKYSYTWRLNSILLNDDGSLNQEVNKNYSKRQQNYSLLKSMGPPKK